MLSILKMEGGSDGKRVEALRISLVMGIKRCDWKLKAQEIQGSFKYLSKLLFNITK